LCRIGLVNPSAEPFQTEAGKQCQIAGGLRNATWCLIGAADRDEARSNGAVGAKGVAAEIVVGSREEEEMNAGVAEIVVAVAAVAAVATAAAVVIAAVVAEAAVSGLVV
jgi:hypothetical protein